MIDLDCISGSNSNLMVGQEYHVKEPSFGHWSSHREINTAQKSQQFSPSCFQKE